MALCEEVPTCLPVDISNVVIASAAVDCAYLTNHAIGSQGQNETLKVGEIEWPDSINLLIAGRPEQPLVKIKERVK